MCKELADIEIWFRKEISVKNEVLWDEIKHKANKCLASTQFIKIFFSEMLLEDLKLMEFISNLKDLKNSHYIVVILRSMTEQVIECLYLLEYPGEIDKYLRKYTENVRTKNQEKDVFTQENILYLSKLLLRYRGGHKRKSIKEMTESLQEGSDLYEIYSILSEVMHNIYCVDFLEAVENSEHPIKHDTLFENVHTELLQGILKKFLKTYHKGTGLTICIMVYNEQDYIEETLKMAVRNYELADYIYISDNCSTDDGMKDAERYEKVYRKIILFRQAQKQPAAKHMLWLLQQVKTEYILFLRPKNVLSENFIQLCLDKLKECPDAVATYPDVHYVDQEQRLNLTKGIYKDSKDYFDKESLAMESNDIRERVEFVSRRDMTHIVYQVCRTDALLECVMRTEYEESGGDNIFALRMAILGKWMLVKEAKYYYYVRKETRAETAERLKSAGFHVEEKNPYWYVPLEFLKICRLKIPQIFDESLKEKIIFNFRLRRMELDDEAWVKRHTKGWMVSNIKEKGTGKDIVLFGTGECAEEIYKRIQDKINVSFFIDSDDRKWDKEFFSKKICAPQSVRDGNFVVCIASNRYMHEMIEQMKKYGYIYFENLFCLTGELPYEYL